VKKIKNMFVLSILLSAGLALMLAISLRGEQEYLRNCRSLGIECQPGNVHVATEYVVEWFKKTYQQVREKFNSSAGSPAGQKVSGQ